MCFCWSLLSPHRSNSDIISCCLRFVKNFFQLFYFFFFDLNNTEKEGFEPSRRFNTTYTLSRGASSASWVFLLNYFKPIFCLRLTAHFLLYSCVLQLSSCFLYFFTCFYQKAYRLFSYVPAQDIAYVITHSFTDTLKAKRGIPCGIPPICFHNNA